MTITDRLWRGVRERPGTAATIALVAGLTLAVIGLDSVRADDQSSNRRAAGKAIAQTQSNGWRVKLTALRGAEGRAKVRIAAFRRADGDWRRVGRPLRVGRSSEWLWRVVTRRYGVHTFNVRIKGGGDIPLLASVRLLRSPSIGPSAPYRFAVDNGRWMPIDV